MLKAQTILLISPQKWGKMFLSKHHYALELAKRGNEVIYMNTPSVSSSILGEISQHESIDNLFILDYKTFFPIRLKTISSVLFNFLMKIQVFLILRKNNLNFDLVWSFESGLFKNYKWFNATKTIFFPVDEPKPGDVYKNLNYDFLFSVTDEIINKYSRSNCKKKLINHSISSHFTNEISGEFPNDEKIKTCYIGNLLRNDIDFKIFKELIKENSNIEFHLFGAYEKNQSNIGGDNSNNSFIDFLKNSENVILGGVISPKTLPELMRKMDIFLICYDVKKDQSKGTNYHKIMEYLSMGKVIVSNNVSAYKDKRHLIEMVDSRDHNHELPIIFSRVIKNLEFFNSYEKQKTRRNFALNNTYNKNVSRIESFIYNKA